MRWTVLIALVASAACGSGDRITLTFEDDGARAEAVAIEVAALQPTTRDRAALGCAGLLALADGLDDPGLIVAQRITSPAGVPQGQTVQFVQLPPQRYLFLAEARDAFGFAVARGCATDELTSRRPLDLVIALATVTAPVGRLEPAAATAWLQHAGSPGVEGAPDVAVLARDGSGRPLAGIEVRGLLVAGSGLLVADTGDLVEHVRLTTDADGIAHAHLSAGVGSNRVALHARGLADSPIAFEVHGLASPLYRPLEVYPIVETPVALLGGDFDTFDRADDLVAVLARSTGSCTRLYHGRIQASTSWDQADCKDLPLYDGALELPAIATLAVAGQFDHSCLGDPTCREKPDLAVAGQFERGGTSTPFLALFHHVEDRSRSFESATFEEEIALRPNTTTVTRVLAARIDQDPWGDLVIETREQLDDRPHLQVWRNGGGPYRDPGWFRANPDFYIAGIGDPAVAVGDVDSDGDDDLLLLSRTLGLYIVPNGRDLAGTDSGSLYLAAAIDEMPYVATAYNAKTALVADVDEDGRNDLLVLTDQELLGPGTSLQVARGTGSLDGLLLADPIALPTPHYDHVALVDLNSDQHTDLVLVSNQPPQQALLLGGDGGGQFAAPLSIPLGLSVVDIAFGDLNGDGVIDLGALGRTFDGSFLIAQISASLLQ